MEYEDAVKLEELATAVFDAKLLVDYHRMRNIANLTTEERRQAFIELTTAEAVYEAACGRLQTAKGQMFVYGHLRR